MGAERSPDGHTWYPLPNGTLTALVAAGYRLRTTARSNAIKVVNRREIPDELLIVRVETDGLMARGAKHKRTRVTRMDNEFIESAKDRIDNALSRAAASANSAALVEELDLMNREMAEVDAEVAAYVARARRALDPTAGKQPCRRVRHVFSGGLPTLGKRR
jgi:hypothetical protein